MPLVWNGIHANYISYTKEGPIEQSPPDQRGPERGPLETPSDDTPSVRKEYSSVSEFNFHRPLKMARETCYILSHS